MQQVTRDLIIAAALLLMAVAARAVEPPPPAAPAAAGAAGDRAVRPALETRTNLDPLRGPVANDPRAYPYDAVRMQSPHTWRGYAEN